MERPRYVTDMKEWELPRLEELEFELIEDLIAKAPVPYFDRDSLGDKVHELLLDRLRELAGAAINETIEYWMAGLADGNNGKFPELCIEFPFLQRKEGVDPLTLAYCVDNQDGSRTELLRTTLQKALTLALKGECAATTDFMRRTHEIAAELRGLARQIESLTSGSKLGRLSIAGKPQSAERG